MDRSPPPSRPTPSGSRWTGARRGVGPPPPPGAVGGLLIGLLLCSSGEVAAAGPQHHAGEPSPPAAPNFIVLLIDDARDLEIEYGFGRSLASWTSALETELVAKGMVFDAYYNTTPVCCPARVSLLTGRYAHNTGVHGNNYNIFNGNGGWKKYWEEGYDQVSLGKWLQDAGYTTALVGKFLNQYPDIPGRFVPETYVPAGWNQWFATFNNDAGFDYFNFRMNENGVIVSYGNPDPAYLTDVEKQHAIDFLQQVDVSQNPFFLYLSPFSPHGPIQAPPRHLGMHAGFKVPAPPAFHEADLTDKPQHIQDLAVSWTAFWGEGWNERLDMTLSIDEMIREVIDTLDARGLLASTYIFFASDNGLMSGEHGLSGKSVVYEPSARTPLYVRGPGIPEGAVRPELIANIDLAPTILELAGVPIPSLVDGESFSGLLLGSPISWRQSVLIEFPQARELPSGQARAEESLEPGDLALWQRVLEGSGVDRSTVATRALLEIPAYFGVRTAGWLYVEHETGDRELYDMIGDPHQLESQHLSASQGLLDSFAALLAGLRDCAGPDCGTASRAAVPNALPGAAFEVSCGGGLDCTFDASASTDVDGQITSYEWDFGDGALGAGATVAHSYQPPGRWVYVTLTVWDDAGAQRTLGRDIVVGSDPLFQDGFESGDTSKWTPD